MEKSTDKVDAFFMSTGSKKDAVWSRASHCEKEKPAVHDMPTAGVVRMFLTNLNFTLKKTG